MAATNCSEAGIGTAETAERGDDAAGSTGCSDTNRQVGIIIYTISSKLDIGMHKLKKEIRRPDEFFTIVW